VANPLMAIRVGLFTTLDTNLGDDLVREGVCQVLRAALKAQTVEFLAVNKHRPLTAYPRWHPVQLSSLAGRLPRASTRVRLLIERLAPRLCPSSRFDGCQLIVQCGTPVLWHGCSHSEWADLLWRQVAGRLSRRGVTVLNLGAGSCYAWERQPQRVEDRQDALFLQTILGYCRATTVRDRLAQRLLADLGQPCPLIVCPALLAAGPKPGRENRAELLVLNYMEGGGHYDLAQGIDNAGWRATFRRLIERLRPRHRLLFLCHNEREDGLAAALDPTIPRFLPKNAAEFFAGLASAKAALCNRLHASIALAGLGVPSVAVGTDTRLLMVAATGLPALFVKEAVVDHLEQHLEDLLRARTSERERLLALRQRTWDEYAAVVATALSAGA
jgi:hypothetical protein